MTATNYSAAVFVQSQGVFSAFERDFNASLDAAKDQAKNQGLPFSGTVSPQLAWQLFSEGVAVIVDVRSAEERKFVGHVPGTLHVAWATGLSLVKNARFVGELGTKVKKEEAILFLCRSGKRSALAAEAAKKAGYSSVFNIAEGFEGEISEAGQRGWQGGWKYHKLPWVQD